MLPFLFNCEVLVGIGYSSLFQNFFFSLALVGIGKGFYYCWMKEETGFYPQVIVALSDN